MLVAFDRMSALRRSTGGPLLVATLLTAALAVSACSGGASLTASAQTPSGSPEPSITTPASSASPSVVRTTAPPSSPHPTTAKPKPKPSAPPKSVPGTPGEFVFPVVGNVSYAHTHHDYPATDIIANCGDTVRAVTSGVILEVTRVDTWKASVDAGATRGGLSVSIKGDDGIRYYGSHLEEINKNIQPGVRVTVGETLGKVGRTGDAGACHLHFGISPVCKGTGDWWIQRGMIWPWPYLDSWRKGGHMSPVTEIHTWQKKNGCPTKPLTDP